MKQELKLRLLDPDAWGTLLSHPLLDLHDLSPVPMDAVYLDTADGALHRAGIAYRVRHEGERWIAAVKGVGTSAGGWYQRPEWTVVVEEDKPSPQVFADTEAGAMLFAAVGENILLPLLETHFQRFERELSWEDGSGILIAADRGEILAGDARAAILELDLKLLHGHPAALLELGSILARDLPLLPDPQGRMHRGLVLAGLIADNQGGPSLACPMRHRDVAGDDLVRLLVTQCQRALGGLSRHLTEPMDATCFHDLRKDVRALRSFLRLADNLLIHRNISAPGDKNSPFGSMPKGRPRPGCPGHSLGGSVCNAGGAVQLAAILSGGRCCARHRHGDAISRIPSPRPLGHLDPAWIGGRSRSPGIHGAPLRPLGRGHSAGTEKGR